VSNPADSIWLDPRLNLRLRELHRLKGDDELNMGEIADRLSSEFKVVVTRNAVIGRCHRLDLPRRVTPLSPRARKQKVEKPMIIRKIRVDAPIVPEMPVADPAAGLTILQLSPDSCRWPLGDLMQTRPPYLFCGKVIRVGTPYCPVHDDRARGRPFVRSA
jgi:hypothetical protein